jgi:hypothetical protein
MQLRVLALFACINCVAARSLAIPPAGNCSEASSFTVPTGAQRRPKR